MHNNTEINTGCFDTNTVSSQRRATKWSKANHVDTDSNTCISSRISPSMYVLSRGREDGVRAVQLESSFDAAGSPFLESMQFQMQFQLQLQSQPQLSALKSDAQSTSFDNVFDNGSQVYAIPFTKRSKISLNPRIHNSIKDSYPVKSMGTGSRIIIQTHRRLRYSSKCVFMTTHLFKLE